MICLIVVCEFETDILFRDGIFVLGSVYIHVII